jgi:DNA repair protein RadA/Sms
MQSADSPTFFCDHCEAELAQGCYRCTVCGQYSFPVEQEETEEELFMSLADVDDVPLVRLLDDEWWSPIFGGGFTPDQMMLLGGEPGAGKSVWALIVGERMAEVTDRPTLYLNTEESREAIKDRCRRLEIDPGAFMMVTSPLDESLVCLDSTLHEFGFGILDAVPDLVGDDPMDAVRALKRIRMWARERQAPFLALDHVNKGEELAGLMRLRHEVDTTIYLHGDDVSPERLMTVIKNRHGQGHKSLKLRMRSEDEPRPGLLEPVDPDKLCEGRRRTNKRDPRRPKA